MRASALLVLVTGCAPASPAPAPIDPPKPPPQVGKPPVQKPAEGAPVDNPRRVYQLRDLQRTTLKVSSRQIPVWVMDTDGKRQEGMMFLTDSEVKADEGMLFVFPRAEAQSFWMENTILALDIAYITSAGKVLNVVRGKPFNRNGLPSKGAAQFVLELKAGSAARLGVRAGATVQIPKHLHSQD